MFELHPQLAKDCFQVGRFPLSLLLLMNDSTYPWFILVPDRDAVTEIFQLEPVDQLQLMRDSVALSQALATAFGADKMNVAALGNVVAQLHVHHIVRYRDDPAWPGPVWGKVARRPYTDAEREQCIARLKSALVNGVDYRA